MHYITLSTIILFAFSGASLAQDPFESMSIDHCDTLSGNFHFCANQELSACLSGAETEGVQMEWGCQNAYNSLTDNSLNSFFLTAIENTRALEASMSESAYGDGLEDLLRSSQRAWIDVRDTTCDLLVEYGAVMSGRDSYVSECRGHMTAKRIDSLVAEIGQFLTE